MKTAITLLVLFSAGSILPAGERTVVIPRDDKSFVVKKDELVRLAGECLPGGTVEAKVDGPAKIETTSTLRDVKGGQTVIGAIAKEFDVMPTEVGKVTVTITITSPIPDRKPKVSKYRFEVK